MGIVDDVSLETVVAVFDVWLLLDALAADSAVTYDFLRRPAVYESLRRPTRQVPRPTTPTGIQALGPSGRDDNLFWQQYAQIEPDTLGWWDRQEPFRLEIPDRVHVAPAPNVPRLICLAPEVFVFPSGWSTTLWLRIIDKFPLHELPKLLWALNTDARITVTARTSKATLTEAMDVLRERVGALMYHPSLRRRARRVIRQRIVAVINREGPDRGYEYLDEDFLVMYGALEPSDAGMESLSAMEQSSLKLNKLVIRYGRGIFLDTSARGRDGKEHWRRCNARNLRNMIMMCAVLEATVRLGALTLPPDAATLMALPAHRREDLRLLYRLVSGSQRTLRSLPAAFRNTAAAYYWGRHRDIQQAVALALPTL